MKKSYGVFFLCFTIVVNIIITVLGVFVCAHAFSHNECGDLRKHMKRCFSPWALGIDLVFSGLHDKYFYLLSHFLCPKWVYS